MLHAMSDMIAQDLLFEPSQCSTDRRNLSDDVDTVSIFLDHAADPADLAFDPIQSFRACFLDVTPHAAYIPPSRIGCNSAPYCTGGRFS